MPVISARVGDVRVTRVCEGDPDRLPIEVFSGAAAAAFARHREWMPPQWFDTDGTPLMPVSAWVLETAGRTVLVDACAGTWPTPREPGGQSSDFLDRLAEAGFTPADIDVVVSTHLHFDHVGWNTRPRPDGCPVATFPNATYLFGDVEWRSESSTPLYGTPSVTSLDYAVRPLLESGQGQLIDSEHRIVREIGVLSAPGHTPGHLCVTIASGDETAVITGDVAHNPVQLAAPEIGSVFDVDGDLAIQTRASLIQSWTQRGTLILGTHFPGRGIGTLEPFEDTVKFVESR